MNTTPMDNSRESRIDKSVTILEESIAKFGAETYHRGHLFTFKTVSSCHKITH